MSERQQADHLLAKSLRTKLLANLKDFQQQQKWKVPRYIIVSCEECARLLDRVPTWWCVWGVCAKQINFLCSSNSGLSPFIKVAHPGYANVSNSPTQQSETGSKAKLGKGDSVLRHQFSCLRSSSGERGLCKFICLVKQLGPWLSKMLIRGVLYEVVIFISH